MISGEVTCIPPNSTPIKSGLCDADLFGGAIPKGPPALRGVNLVVWRGDEPCVFDDILKPLEDNTLMRDVFYTIPQLVV